jgi:phospholipid/cholesterol/gamma-HCH transport system substrate-binding protein
MSARRGTRLAALAGAGALLLSGCEFSVYSIPLPGGADVGDNPYEVEIEFRDVLDLVPQSAVKVDDVSVGRVEDIEVDEYTALVTVTLHEDVELPGNAVAGIRQTSLLGEKFVDLSPPASNPSSEMLGDGDLIPLDRSGRNPEVEEVLGALSLFLNGGGVGQLKIISEELNTLFEGRESEIKSSLRQFRTFMEGLDAGKEDIVRAIESVNSLAIELNKNEDTLELALDELPSAIASVDSQREDLVRMLQALARLSGVGTRVIQASKQNTINSLQALAPTLTELAKSGDDLVDSLQIILTFPFIDAVVGTNPVQARDLQMGDYTNLDLTLDLDLRQILENIGEGGPDVLPAPPGGGGGGDLPVDPDDIIDDPGGAVDELIGGGGGGGNGGGGNGGGGGGGGGGLPDLPGLGRAPVGQSSGVDEDRVRSVHDLAAMLAWGVSDR